MTINELKQLAIYAAKGQAPTNFSVENVDEALADGLREMAGSINQFMKNRYDIYDIIISAADEIVPKKVIDAVGMFAEVQQVPQGTKAMFRTKLGRMRAKKFLTQVGLSGVYETFRLDNGRFEVAAHAVGGGCRIDFERMLDGAENMAELVDLLTEAQTDAVYQEVQRALRAAVNQTGVPANNRANVTVGNTFDGAEMMKLITTVRAYGSGAVIFAPLGFDTWQAVASSLSGFVAKEGIVSTMGVLSGIGEVEEYAVSMHDQFAAFFPTTMVAVSFLLFNLFDSPCLAAISTTAKELNNRKFFWFTIIFQNVSAYCVTLMFYQIVGLCIGEVAFNFWTVVAFVLLAGVLYLLFRKDPNKATVKSTSFAASNV